MKFNRGVALGTSLFLVLSACGNAQQERTRNNSVAECRDPLVQAASQKFLQTQILEVERLKSDWTASVEKVGVARDAMEKVRDNVPQNLKDAVKRFDDYDSLVRGLDKRIEEVEKSSETSNMKRFITSPLRYEKTNYEYRRDQAKEEMNSLLVIRGEQITKVNDVYNSAVIRHDAAHHAYLTASDAYNKVVALTVSCLPMISAGDAETYVADAAAQAPPTSVQRQVFQFFDEPAPSEEVNQQGGVDSSEDSTSSSSSTTLPTTEPSISMPAPSFTVPSSQGDSESSVNKSLFPKIVVNAPPQLEIYEAPKTDQILEDLKKSISDLYSSGVSNSATSIAELLEQLTDIIERTDENKSSEANILLSQAAESISVIVEIASQKSGSEFTGVSKKSFSVVAFGFKPQSDVVVVSKDVKALARTKASEDGIVNFEMSSALIPSQDGSALLYLGGTKKDGKVSAVPFLVNSNIIPSSSDDTNSLTVDSAATTLPKEPVEESDSNSTKESVSDTSSSMGPWIGLVAFILLVAGLSVVLRNRKRQELDQ